MPGACAIAWAALAVSAVLAAEPPSDNPAAALENLPGIANEYRRDLVLRHGFEWAIARQPERAVRYLPLVLDRPWLSEVSFHDACVLARRVAADDPAAAERLVTAPALRQPELALREIRQFLDLPFGNALFRKLMAAAPAEAMSLATGNSPTAGEMRAALEADGSPEAQVLLRIAGDDALDVPSRQRVAVFDLRIAQGSLSLEQAARLAASTPRYFAALVDARTAAPPDGRAGFDRALAGESLLLCLQAQEAGGKVPPPEMAQMRGQDLYLLLAYGRAETSGPVFPAIFDRLLAPRLRSEGTAFTHWLERAGDWELRDFAAAAVDANRLDSFVALTGPAVVARLAVGLPETADPLHEAVRLAEIIGATRDTALLLQIGAAIAAEYARAVAAGNRQCALLYATLAARLLDTPAANDELRRIGEVYRPYLTSVTELDTAAVFDASGLGVERYFFYDDDDGVESFESFRASYASHPNWTIEDHGAYLHLTGQGRAGRRIEIFANVPIDGHLPANRGHENEAATRQEAIAEALRARSLTPTVLVHRGHSFWVEKTLAYLTPSARLVVLGSCGGAAEIHAVLETAHDAEVIATRGIGATEINDRLLKSLNDRLLDGGATVVWRDFWREQTGRLGRLADFRDYLAPDQDAASVFLRAYYRAWDR